MAFCVNCGHEVPDGAKFCANCGAAVNSANSGAQRKTVYEGEMHKCPNCGEVLNSFVSVCPACGYELRGTKASNSVHEFALRLERAQSEEQRITLIRNFPIPNTKEDIFEFMILASTNISGEYQKIVFDAWLAKFEQSYKKAKLVFSNDSDFVKFQSIYEQTNKQISKEKNIRTAKTIGNTISKSAPALPRIAVSIGWLISIFVLIPLCGSNLDVAGTNSYQLLLIVDFIAGAIVLPWIIRGKSSIPALITAVGLMISIVVLIPLCGKNLDVAGTNAYQLILIIDIVASVVIFVRAFKKRKG
ncbi:MAG: zinc-ribbon domain-containing protein [Oscillospiraceae bacterium]